MVNTINVKEVLQRPSPLALVVYLILMKKRLLNNFDIHLLYELIWILNQLMKSMIHYIACRKSNVIMIMIFLSCVILLYLNYP